MQRNLAFDNNGELAIPTEEELNAQFAAANAQFDALFPPRRAEDADPETVDLSPADPDAADISPADFEDWLYGD